MKYSEQGFTLVELALVLTVIGLLTAGALKASAILENARVTSFLSQLAEMKNAHVSFENTYRALPGDIDAIDILPGCETGNTNFCYGGDENGAIGVVGNIGSVSSTHLENRLYWKHLALSDFYGGLDVSVDVRESDNFEAGITHPRIYPKTVMEIVHVTRDGCTLECSEGPTYRLLRTFEGTTGTPGNSAIKPLYAEKIDTKIDDGLPDTGHVQAESQASECDVGRVYNTQNDSYNCTMFFEVNYY